MGIDGDKEAQAGEAAGSTEQLAVKTPGSTMHEGSFDVVDRAHNTELGGDADEQEHHRVCAQAQAAAVAAEEGQTADNEYAWQHRD